MHGGARRRATFTPTKYPCYFCQKRPYFDDNGKNEGLHALTVKRSQNARKRGKTDGFPRGPVFLFRGGPEGVGFSVPILPTTTRREQGEQIRPQQIDAKILHPVAVFSKVNYIYFTGCNNYTNQWNNNTIN